MLRRRLYASGLAVLVAAVSTSAACTATEPSDQGAPAVHSPGASPSRVILTPTANPRTSQALTWRTSTAVGGRVQVRRASTDRVRTIEAHRRDVTAPGWGYSSRHHTAVVSKLRPDTRYRYRVGSKAGWSRWSGFRTAHGRHQPWTFAYFGDAQLGLDGPWARTVDRALRHRDVDLMLQVGDLVDEPADDWRWSSWFRALRPYRRTTNTVSAVGNHELRNDPHRRLYRSQFHFPRNGPARRDETAFVVDYQGVRFIVLDTNQLPGAAQRRFLERELRHDGGRWTVVLFHKPMFANAVDRDSTAQRDAWLHTLERYDADLVLQGHDHSYGRGFVRSRATEAAGRARRPMYVVSVGGGKYYDLDKRRRNDWTRHGARRVEAEGHTSTYQLVRVTRRSLTYRSIVSVNGPGGRPGKTIDRFRLRR